ncbi:MAG: serine/threonine protein kinase [Candidatus Obscuribacterales bacterium]|nr:serine/threonine protein kinase [Candidatus Obscuribacterales bacterium]
MPAGCPSKCAVVIEGHLEGRAIADQIDNYQQFAEVDQIEPSAPSPADESDLADTTAPDPMIGYLLDGRYELLEAIGSGGMSIVYKARLNNVNKLFAIKTLNIQVQARDNVRERFNRETTLLLKLEHPHIVSVQDCLYGPNNQPYLVMDLLRGITLEQELLKSGPLSWNRVRKIMIQVCAAVKYAHQHAVVHRDLKPGNIMLLENEVDFVKVLDFGLALIGENTRKITQSGEFWGSPPYASPEQVKGNDTDHRSDIYSLGCVMYELLTGKDPFHGSGLYELLNRHVNETPAEMAVTNPDVKVPPEMEKLVFKCLEKNPESRFQSVAELQQALENLTSESGQIAVGNIRSISSQSPKRGGIFLSLILAVLLIVGVLFYLQNKTEQSSTPEKARITPGNVTDVSHVAAPGEVVSKEKGVQEKQQKSRAIAKVAPAARTSSKRDAKAMPRSNSKSNSKPPAKSPGAVSGDPFARLREHLSDGAKSE